MVTVGRDEIVDDSHSVRVSDSNRLWHLLKLELSDLLPAAAMMQQLLKSPENPGFLKSVRHYF